MCGGCADGHVNDAPDPGAGRAVGRRHLIGGLGLGLGAATLGAAGVELFVPTSAGAAASAGSAAGANGPGDGGVAALKRKRAAAIARDRELALEVHDSTTDLDGTSAEVNSAVAAVSRVGAALDTARVDLAAAQTQLAEAVVVDRRAAVALNAAQSRLVAARSDLATTRAQVVANRDAVGEIARNAYTHAQVPGLLGFLGSGPDPDLIGAQHTVATVIAGENETIADLRTLAGRERSAAERLGAVEAQTARARLDSEAAVQRVAVLTDTARERTQALTDLLAQRRQVLAAAQRARALAVQQFQVAAAERARNQTTLRALGAAEKRAVARDRARALAEARTARGRRAALARRQAQQGAPAGSGTGAHRLAYPVIAPITSPFGMRFHPILHIWELHDGTDFGCPTGTPIHAAASGTILSCYFNVAYGNRVIMDNGIIDGIPLGTSYNHLSQFLVSPGQHVEVGQTVALSGATGWVTGPHLHFMVYENGTPVDPMTWL